MKWAPAGGVLGSRARAVADAPETRPAHDGLAEAIVKAHGRSSIDFYKLSPDKSYFFSGDRACVIAYKTAWGVAVSLGDPAGPLEELEEAVRRFLRFCAESGWKAAFHQVLPDLLPIYRRLGFEALKIGEEALVDLDRFASHTRQRRAFRRAQRRLDGEGYELGRYEPPHPEVLLDELEAVSGEWLSLPGRSERIFAQGRFDRGYLGRTPVFAVRDPGGRLAAFVNEIPSFLEGEATVDLMRHRRGAPNGVMDYLFAGVMLAFRQRGFRRFSLGLAPLAGVGDRPGATLAERAVHQLFEHLHGVFSFKGLRAYKAKFEPGWEDRFLVYQGRMPGLVRTALALRRATEVP
jgi:phosphatidylglycerol lysyltransferase